MQSILILKWPSRWGRFACFCVSLLVTWPIMWQMIVIVGQSSLLWVIILNLFVGIAFHEFPDFESALIVSDKNSPPRRQSNRHCWPLSIQLMFPHQLFFSSPPVSIFDYQLYHTCPTLGIFSFIRFYRSETWTRVWGLYQREICTS